MCIAYLNYIFIYISLSPSIFPHEYKNHFQSQIVAANKGLRFFFIITLFVVSIS